MLFVVSEERVLDQAVHVLVCQARGLAFVQGIHTLDASINFVGVGTMAVGGKDDEPRDFLISDVLENLFAFGGKAIPSILGARFHLRCHRDVGAEHFEGGWLLERLLEPFQLSWAKH